MWLVLGCSPRAKDHLHGPQQGERTDWGCMGTTCGAVHSLAPGARTHLDTSAMCKCRSSTHRSSSSSSSTAFSRASLSPVVSYLRETEGQGNQPTTRDPGADWGGG